MKMNKKGIEAEGVTDILIWVIFLIIAGAVVYVLVKRLTG